jgi:penicillin-binding protein A
MAASKSKAARRQPQRRVELMPLFIVGALALFAMTMWIWRGNNLVLPSLTIVPQGMVDPTAVAIEPPPLPFSVPELPARSITRSWRELDGKAVLVRPDKSKLTLTLNVAAQSKIERLLKANRNAHSAVVIIEAATGAVRVFADHTQPGDPAGAGHTPSSARQPAASIFKIVTSAALLEAGVLPTDTTCFHGGASGLRKWHLKDRPKFDKRCETLTQALANSSNVVFARRALKHLQTGALTAKASDFLFGVDLGFDVVGRRSKFIEGTRDLRRARAAAGFTGSRMSPIHGAVIGAALANKGVAMRPYLIAADSLQPQHTREPAELQPVVSEQHAAMLVQMLATTATNGTARRAFKKWPKRLAHVGVAAKTGSLNGRGSPWRHYSWFVGAAPATRPEIGFAVLSVNGRKGRAKAADLARAALAIWFADRAIKPGVIDLATAD